MATMQMSVRPEDLSQVPHGKERIPEPGILVIFGASGDLTKRKLLPALFHLRQNNLLPKKFAIVGVARRPLGDEFAADMREGIVEFGGVDASDPKLDEFVKHISYFRAELRRPGELCRPEDRARPDRTRKRASAATGFSIWPPRRSSLPALSRTWARRAWRSRSKGEAAVVIEKPFGHDLDSARELNHQVNAVFHESQVFRIDHYLGKETVQNILVFRFANGIFEPVWNRNYIDHVQITAAETLGVEGRGPFYEKAGALRDVVQNHMMELLSFVAMEPPSSFEAESVRREKLKVWQAIPPIPILNAVRGQYGPGIVNGQHVVGYRDEERVNPESGTETYAALRLEIENWRWAGVPIYLRAGKRLKKRATEISIQFKQPPLLIFNRMAGQRALPGDSAQPADHPHPARRGDCAALRGQGAHHAEYGRLPGEHGLRLRGGVWQIERQRLRAAAAGRHAGRPDAVRAPRRRGDHLGAVYADSAGMGGKEAGGVSQLLCRNLGPGVLRPPAGARRACVAKQSGPKGLRTAILAA